MPIPDACLAQDYGGGPAGGGGPGAPEGIDGTTPVGPGQPIDGGTNTGPTEGPLENYAPGFGSDASGWPIIMVVQKMRKDIYLELKDNVCGGPPSDISHVDHFKFLCKEWMSAPEIYMTKDCVVVDPAKGLIKIKFKPKNLPYAGIWPGAVQGFNSDGEIVAQYKCYLHVLVNMAEAGKGVHPNQPIQPHEIRLEMRDTCPEANTLLEDVEFSDLEIMYAITKPIEEWNETPPDLSGSGASFTQNTFPWRHEWRKAVVGYLLQTAAIYQQRNAFTYSAGGVSIKDKDKATPYMGIADKYLSEWRQWLLLKKRELNIELCYGGVISNVFGAPYGYPYNGSNHIGYW